MRPATLTITVLASPSFSRYKRPSFSGKRLDNIEEERSEYHVNLGSESPRSIMNEDIIAEETSLMARSGIAANTEIPPRTRLWRSSSFTNKMPKRSSSKDWVDRDCGICFEMAVVPCRTLCCGKLFCLEHLAEWLHGSSSDGLCPSCKTPCTLEKDTLSLASPKLSLKLASPAPSRLAFHEPSSSVDSDLISSASSSDSDTSCEENDSPSDEEMQTIAFEANHLSEDALSRIVGKVLSIVA
ncbi:hypothetical protein CPB85DRAFT_1297437 [Mucidula mucida]|nr:hypothetical protein CPB85DRAFT_1297437 [Mucidula mucida]